MILTMEKAPTARPGSLENIADASITWRYFAPAGVTLEMCSRPDYWSNCIRELGQQRVNSKHAWNKIEIIAEDGTWEAELRVLSATAGLVTTRVIREWHLPARPGRKPNLPDGYTVEFIPANGWRALDSRSAVVADRLPVEEEAIRAASAHAKAASGREAA